MIGLLVYDRERKTRRVENDRRAEPDHRLPQATGNIQLSIGETYMLFIAA